MKDYLAVEWDNLSQKNGGPNQSFMLILDYMSGNIRMQYEKVSGTNAWPITEVGLNTALGTPILGTLADNQFGSLGATVTVTTNETVEFLGYDQDPMFQTNITVTTTYADSIINRAIEFSSGTRLIYLSSLGSTLPIGATDTVVVYGDARRLTGAASENRTFTVTGDGTPKNVNVTLTVAATAPSPAPDSDMDGLSDMEEWTAGTDANDVGSSFTANIDESRTISWPQPSDGFSRTYVVYYSTDLTEGWTELVTLTDEYSFTDTLHNDLPVVYYKVTVK
jgi:hypothetical protein